MDWRVELTRPSRLRDFYPVPQTFVKLPIARLPSTSFKDNHISPVRLCVCVFCFVEGVVCVCIHSFAYVQKEGEEK